MPPNDVVSHKVATGAVKGRKSNAEEGADMFTGARLSPLIVVKPPTTVKIGGPLLNEAPFRSVGKMEMKFDPLAIVRRGSGWVVAPRAFITAGHCVWYHGYGGWVYSATFCPRFDAGCSKQFIVEEVYTLQGWIDSGANEDRQYDLAACVVTERFTGAEPPLSFRLGDPSVDVHAIGYPGKPTTTHDFNGQRMWQTSGEVVDLEDGTSYAENDFTGGASGGPWVDKDDVVRGITSSRADDPNVAISPLLNEGFQNLYDTVKDL